MPKKNLEKASELEELRKAYVYVFGGPSGKIVMRDIRKNFFLDRTTFVPGDPQGTAFREGLRMAALHILNRQRKDLLKVYEEDEG